MREKVEQYNAGLISADELDQAVNMENMSSDYRTYAISYAYNGRAMLLTDGMSHPCDVIDCSKCTNCK